MKPEKRRELRRLRKQGNQIRRLTRAMGMAEKQLKRFGRTVERLGGQLSGIVEP